MEDEGKKVELDPTEIYLEGHETLHIPMSKFFIVNAVAQYFAFTPEELLINIAEDLLGDIRRLSERQKSYAYNKVPKSRILSDLINLKGSFCAVDKDLAPNQDKGIYFDKAMRDLDNLIIKYKPKEK